MKTNENTGLEPRIPFEVPAIEFDFPAFQIGVAEYPEGPTGCTVFLFPKGADTAIDVRGGTVGAVGNHPWNHAICFAGGSFYGLAAAAGVASELFASKGYATGFRDIARVSGAVIYDFPRKDNAIYPDAALGRAAVRSARPGWFPLGARGAGCSATVGKGLGFDQAETSGQGGAFRQIGPTKIAAFTVVNAIGAVVDRSGRVIRGHRDPETGTRSHLLREIEKASGLAEPPRGNTTLTLVVTNQRLDGGALQQTARQIHGSMGRAIQPFHTVFDGDSLYAVTTNEIDNRGLNQIAFGAVASEVVWDAVLGAVREGTEPPGGEQTGA